MIPTPSSSSSRATWPSATLSCAGLLVVYQPLRLKLIKRLFILFDPLYDGPRAITVRHGRIELSTETPSKSFSLVVVDESHHIYANPQLKNCVESHVTPTTQRLLISDVSQSLGWEIDYPMEIVAEVVLTEVVRSTQRIVAGAAAFQLGDKKLLTGNAHNATGPPLKTFVFDVPRKVEAARNPSVYAEAREKAYVEHTVKALKHVSTTLGALDLHDRVAIVMPSEESAGIIRKPLESAVGDAFCGRASRRPRRRSRHWRERRQRRVAHPRLD